MDEMNYKPNSHKYKEEQKKATEERQIKKVISGTAKVKKKSGARKFTDALISEDASNVKTYILSDVILPAAKKLISDIVRDGIDMLLYGSTQSRGKSYDRFGIGHVNYGSFSSKRTDDRRSSGGRHRFEYDDIIFESRGEVEAVREQMEDVIDRYGYVTVADLYDMAELTAPHTANKFGWTSVRSADVVRVRDGYVLKLSRPGAID